MNRYETIFLLNTKLKDSKRKKIVNMVKKCMHEYGKIENFREIGVRKIPYEIKKQKEAYYYEIIFLVQPECIVELERLYRIRDEVLQYITIKIDI